MEVEFVAWIEAIVQTNWLLNFILGLGVVNGISRPLKIYCDNSAAVFFSKNDKRVTAQIICWPCKKYGHYVY